MQLRLSMANIVVLAKNHNPAIASVDWLKKIISDEEDAINFTNTPVFSVCEFQSFIFTVTPDHLQVVLKTPSEPNVPRLQKVVSNYIEALPETPYTAVGLNYIWIVSFDSQEDASGLLKRLFIADESRIKTSLERNNYQAGGILVFEDEIVRTRLLVEAVKEFPNNISCNFNYHSDVKDFKYALQAISVYQEKNIESKQIVSHLFEIG